MRTLLLDCPFSLDEADKFSFKSLVSIFDYDLVIWDPARTSQTYQSQYQPQYRGRPSPTEADAVAFNEDVARRQKEFAEFLELGRAIVVIASPAEVFYIDTGEKKTSGTGRNQKVTRLVEPLDLLDALPIPLESTPGRGLELELASDAASPLWRRTRGSWVYRCTLDKFPGDPILKVAGIDKVAGSLLITESGGLLALLPEPWLQGEAEDEDFDEDLNDYVDQPHEGGSSAAADHSETDVIKAIYDWIAGLAAIDDEAPPEWAGRFLLGSEVERSSRLVAAESEMAKLVRQLDDFKAAQAEDSQWKRLLTAQGEPLERQVEAAFVELGFTALETRRGRGDLRLDLDGRRVVVEVKGLARSAAEKHAAQLEKWVAEELADGVHAKGILVVNGYREAAPDERGQVFPDQMLSYAAARGHCLVTGVQLLAMRVAARDNPDLRPDLRSVLMETVGIVEGYSDLGVFLEEPPAPAGD